MSHKLWSSTAVILFIIGIVTGVHGLQPNHQLNQSASHPIIGTWLQGGEPERLLTFFVDGNAFVTDSDGGIYQGRWEQVNENVVNATFAMIAPNPGVMGQGFGGAMLVTDDGRLYADPSGEPAGQIQPDPRFANDIDLEHPRIQELLEAPSS